ncbi:MAG: hypothetical protein ACTJHT_03720, partial [Sphingobacterium sp.]
MGNTGLSFSSLYRQALANPVEVSLEDLERLISKYPYSQPLYFARERRRYISDGTTGELAAHTKLLASSPNWLFEYLHLPLEQVPMVDVVDDDYVAFEDVEPVDSEHAPTKEPDQTTEIEAADQEDMPGTEPLEATDRADHENPIPQFKFENLNYDLSRSSQEDDLHSLVNEGIGGGDFFALHSKPVTGETAEEGASRAEKAAQKTEKEKEEDISLYNDELMPYSFRWWLHKTRLEFAETYQPFASPSLPIKNKPAFDASELDRVILDQQIRESIIHLQDPEDKLSDATKQRATAPPAESRTTEVIERFIREEPQIQPPPAEQLNMENKARKSSEEQFDLVTE